MRARVAIPLIAALALVGGLLLGAHLPGQDGTDNATAPGGPNGSNGSSAPPVQTSPPPPVPDGSQPNLENYPIEKLAPGQEPPQFVVVSFDGACDHDLFEHWYNLGQAENARFTFFMSGLCLLPDAERLQYDPPHKAIGSSAIGFADPTKVNGRIQDWSTAWNSGYGIGSHFLGHFCDSQGVSIWNTHDWESELDQQEKFLDDWKTYNATNKSADLSLQLPFSFADVQGDRTPCLEGRRDQMYPAFAARHFTYDASSTGYMRWPQRLQKKYGSMWDFTMPTIKLVGNKGGADHSISMDYNILYQFTEGKTDPPKAVAQKIQTVTYNSLMAAVGALDKGNRAPFFVGNHFNTWADNAFTNSLTKFIQDAPKQYPDVRFVSFEYLVKWLDAQDPKVLKALQARPIQSY